ncbi:MAG TPA: iron-dependent repressor, partial [Algoriphagus sp.]|nr:iron-dependent repressor [Algoriphagus sp.]
MNLTTAEENYLKAIYHLSDGGKKSVSTNDVAGEMNTKPASV